MSDLYAIWECHTIGEKLLSLAQWVLVWLSSAQLCLASLSLPQADFLMCSVGSPMVKFPQWNHIFHKGNHSFPWGYLVFLKEI